MGLKDRIEDLEVSSKPDLVAALGGSLVMSNEPDGLLKAANGRLFTEDELHELIGSCEPISHPVLISPTYSNPPNSAVRTGDSSANG